MIYDEAKLRFRIATVNDSNILSEHRVKFLNEVYNINYHPEEEHLKTELIDYFSKSISNNTVIAWLAEYENKVISTSTLVIWNAPFSYSGLGKNGKRGYILNMYTLLPFRKKGIASTLLKKLILEAKNNNLEFVNLHATNDGIGVYKKIGFKAPTFPELKYKIEY